MLVQERIMPNTAVAALKKASKGLLYQSEQDEPFTTFSWRSKEDPTPEVVRKLGKHKPDSPVEELSVAEFFADLTCEEAWHGPDEKAVVVGYRGLLAAIQEHLKGATVFRVGETKITIYLVGKTSQGNLAGLKTTALET